jgi:hypothetical protein
MFVFGDRDGRGDSVLLQHPLGVVFEQGYLYVADTYNNKIKRINPAENSSETLLGTGSEGLHDGVGQEALFNEPGGLSIAEGQLYIADTNNQAIRIANLKNYQVRTIQFTNTEYSPAVDEFVGKLSKYDTQVVCPGQGNLSIDLVIPPGYQLTPQAPHTISWQAENDKLRFSSNYLQFESNDLPVNIPFQASEGKVHMLIDVLIYYCSSQIEAYPQCFLAQERIDIPVIIFSEAKSSDIKVNYELAKQMPSNP